MKKIYSVLVALAVLITPYAQAKTCFHNQCNYISNGAFANGTSTGWTLGGGNGVSIVTETSCYSSKAPELQNTEYIQQSFYVDDTYTNGFSLQFRLYHPNDTNNFYDQLNITVTNNDTSVSETFYYHGSSYTTSCGLQVLTLSNDYSNANVTVRFEVAYLANHTFQIDDVAFWGTF